MEEFLAGKHPTLGVKLNSGKNGTFVGMTFRPVNKNTYAPAYYIVEGAKPSEYQALKREFEEFAKGV